jgi:glycosyltransferase involved in cell wall biosynthesis
MIVNIKESDDPTVLGPKTLFLRALAQGRGAIDRLILRKHYWELQRPFSSATIPSLGLLDRIQSENPDIVHLHWIAGGMARFGELAKIEQPIVWTFHDMWGLTGGCHCAFDCRRFESGCGKCPSLSSNFEFDISRRGFWAREQLFKRKKHLTIIALSQWIRSQIERSPFLREANIVGLPNPLDTDLFAPMSKSLARQMLRLDNGKIYLLFSAAGSASSYTKGIDRLMAMWSGFASPEIELLVVGSSWDQTIAESGIPHRFLGRFHDEIALRIVYNTADLCLLPSRQETLPQVVAETHACGVPCVAFRGTGADDIIVHGKTGYLAAADDSADFAQGVRAFLNERRGHSGHDPARQRAIELFNSSEVIRQYMSVYGDIKTHESKKIQGI